MTAVPPTPTARPAPTPQAAPKPPSPPNNLVGVAVLAALVATGYGLLHGMAVKPLTFAFVMLGWTLSVMAHEFSHALTGYMAGDLAFDPRKYGDLGTSLVLPLIFLALGGIGFPGGAVYLRNDLMRGPVWRAAAALAGPMATLMVLLGLAIALRAWMGVGTDSALFPALAFLAFLQATALILNLLPIPGLDGFGAIRPFLPLEWGPGLRKYEGLAMVALFVLLFVTPVGGGLLFGAGMRLTAGLGVPLEAIQIGYSNFHFWR
jgi:Zn-dependent protease